jgi:hypothetical protein
MVLSSGHSFQGEYSLLYTVVTATARATTCASMQEHYLLLLLVIVFVHTFTAVSDLRC